MKGWEHIRAAIRARIEARDWPPGALIPTEEALAEEFGVARTTVNRALRDLAEAGLVERRRKAGTRVAQGLPRRAVLSIPVIRAEVESLGKSFSFQLLGLRPETANAEVAARMGLPEGAPVWWIETLHRADGAPFALERRWLNPAPLPAPLPDFARITVNEWLLQTVPYAAGEIVLWAETAGPAEAVVLGCAEGAALFVVERVTRTEAGPVTWVRLLHAPGYLMRTTI